MRQSVVVVALSGTLLGADAARAQRASTSPASPSVTTGVAPFASSLQIASPGPQVEANGLSYQFVLTWSPRPGAGAYRIFMWTDAARTWYRIGQTTGTTTAAHAFKSGCTAFMVIAFADANAPGTSMTGLEASNTLRFPLSQRPNLCPVQHP